MATTPHNMLILNIAGAPNQTLQRGQKNKVSAKAGQRYRVLKDEASQEDAKDVAASQQGQDLQLRYADGTQVVLENFYTACKAEQCAVDLPGAQGTGSSGGYVITGDSPVGASLAGGGQLVYAYGDSAALAALTPGAEQARGFSQQQSTSTYVPPHDGAALWAPLAAVGAAVLLHSSEAAPVPTIIHGGVVAGPVITGNGLIAKAYKADGSLLASGVVNADGTFTLNIGNDYKGPVLVQVSDTNAAPDYVDEATGAAKDLTSDLRAPTVIPTAGTYTVSVNVLTELAVRNLGLAGGDNGQASSSFASLSQAQITQANQQVAAAVGLTQDLVLGTAPVAIITTTGTSNTQANDYGRLLAALSGAEQGSSTDAVLSQLSATLQSSQAQSAAQVLEILLEGAAKVLGQTQLLAAVSDITNQKSTAVTISTVSSDNRLSPSEMIAGVQVQGTATAGASVTITWSDASGAATATGTRTLTVDSQGQWSTSFNAAEMPALGATSLKASVGSAQATRSIYLDEPLAPTVALTETTGSGNLTKNGRVDVSGILSGAGWDYSTDGGNTWTAGSGSSFTATQEGSLQVQVRQNIGGHFSPVSNTLNFVLDTTAPAAPTFALASDTGTNTSDGITSAGTVNVSGIESGTTWQYSTDGGNTWSTGSGTSFTLAAGSYATGDVKVRQSDAAGNTSGTTSSSGAITMDATAPTVTLNASTTSLGAGATATITFTLSEACPGFSEADVTVSGGTLSNFSGSDTLYTATFTPDAGLSSAATLSVVGGAIGDPAGNLSAATSNVLSISVDTAAPSVSSLSTNQASLQAGQNATLSITLSEDSSNFTVNDLEVVGGTLSNFAGSASSYSVTFTPDDNRTDGGSVRVKKGSFTDAASNASQAGDHDAVVMAISTVRPTATLLARQSTLGVGDATTIDIILSEKSSNFAMADLSATHGTLSAFSALGDGIHYSVIFTPEANYTGTGGVTLASGNFSNAAGNTNSAASSQDLAIDTTPPTVTITSDVAALAIGQSAVITFTFNKDPGASFDASDIAVNGGTLSKLTNHTGKVWTAHFAPTDGASGSASITVGAGAYTDSAGNKGAAGTTPTLSIDTQGPSADLNPANATTVLPGKALVLNFDEAVHKGTGNIVLVNDTDGTRTSLAITDSAVVLSGDGKTLTITPSTALVAGKQYHVEATPGSLLDAAGNAWGGIAASSSWAGSAWHFTAATPSVSLSKISTDGQVNGSENTAGVTISGTIESNTTGMVADFVAGDFAVTLTPQGVGTTINATASSYNTSTGAWSLTLASGALADGKTYDVSVSVTGSSATGPAHNATASTTGQVSVDLSAAAPTLALAKDTGASNSDAITGNADITVSGLEADATWEYKVDSGSWQTGSGNTVKASLADGAHTVTVRQTDAAGNVSADGTLSFTLDTAANRPVIANVTTDNILNASEMASAITGTAEAGASVKLVLGSGAQARTVTATADGSGHWSHTLNSADLAALGSGQTQITAVQTDKAGNESFKTLHNLTVDTAAPTVSIQAASTALNVANGSTLLTFTLSEASSDFTSSSITVTGGTLGTLTQSSTDNTVYTATFTPTNASTTAGSVIVAAGTFHDAAGNANAQTSNTVDLSIDQVLPTVAITSSATALGVGQTATITFTLSEANTDFGASSITTVGGTLGALSSNADGTVYTAIFTPTAGESSASVSVASAAVHDQGANANADGSDANNSVAITMAVPSALTISSDKTSLKAGETATLTFSFSSAPTGFAASDISVTGGTLSALTTVDATHYTAAFTPTASAAGGVASVSVIDGSFTGAGGSAGQGDKLASISFDTLAPTLLSLNPEDGDYLAASANARLVITFTEEVLAGSGNLRLVDDTASSTQTFAIGDSAIVLSGDTLTLTPSTALVAGHNYHVEIDSTALSDRAGNAYVGIANATSWNFSATNLSTTLSPVAGDTRVNLSESGETLVLSGTLSSVNPAVLTALAASDIVVKVTVPRGGGWNDSSNKIITCTGVTYDSSSGAWTATVPAGWTYDGFASDYSVDTLINGDTDTVSVTVTGRTGTAAAGLSTTLTDTFTVDLSNPANPTLALASDTGTSNSDAITQNGTVNVGGLEAGASWQCSLDNGTTWQSGAGSSFALPQDGATTVQVIQRDAAGNASSVVSKAVTLDSHADKPVINAIATDNLINASETGSAITGTAEAGATVSISLGGNTRNATANGSGVWSYALQAADITAMGQGSETLSVTQTDKAGNTSATSSVVVQIDTVVPTVTLANTGSPTLKAGETTTITATLSEKSASFSANSLTVSGGTLSELQADSTGLVYSSTFTPDADSTTGASLQAAIGAVSDSAGNANSSASNTLAITVNTVRPTVAVTSSVAASTTLHAGDTATITFTLSEASSDFSDSDVTVVGGTLSNWNATSATVYTATFTPDANSTAPGSVAVKNGTFSNAATNTNADGDDANNSVSFLIATARPTLTISSDVGTLASGQTAVISFNFSEDPGTSFAWDGSSGDVTVTGGTLSALSGSGTRYTAIFTPTTGFNGAASITVTDGSYTNAAGSTGQAGSTPSITIDTATPTVAIRRSGSGSLVAGQTDTITFDFSEAPGESFTLADVAVSGGTLSALSAVSATEYVAVFTPDTSVTQTGQISIASKTFADAAGNLNADGADANNALAIGITGTNPPASLSLSLAQDTGASANDGITNNPNIEVGGLPAGAAWEYTLDSSATSPTWVSGSDASFALPSTGTYANLAVRLQGNVASTVPLGSTVDYRAAYAGSVSLSLATDSGSSQTDGITKVGVVNVGGPNLASNSWRYTLDNGLTWTSGTGLTWGGPSGYSLTLSGDGSKTLQVEAIDLAGNTRSNSLAFTLDTTAPEAPNVSLTPATNDGGAIVEATNVETGARLQYTTLSILRFIVAQSNTYTAPTVEGSYVLEVRQTDKAGNVSANTSLSFTVTSTAINLSNVVASQGGFVINGQCAYDISGWSVSSAGDVNGDGLADLIVGASESDPVSGGNAGRSYVVFGKTTGTQINLSAVANGVGGFVINGQCAFDQSGSSVSSAGDVNGDGLADLIVGAPKSDPATQSNAGRSYVVFGQTTGTQINLSAVANGVGGFVINGQFAPDNSGVSVSSAGDVNGDGLADLIVGASVANAYAGRSYVVFGKTTGSAIDLSAVSNGVGGFVINGQCASDQSGVSVSSAGDVDGDGLADLIVGASNSDPATGTDAGRSYVVFGKTTGTGIDLSAVANGVGGFVINGQCAEDRSGNRVSSAGDVNGDGLADLIVGASDSDPTLRNAGRSYVVFGKTTGTEINLSAVAAGEGGFVINGQCSPEYSGYSVSSAGDVNGDGLADLIVGAIGTNAATGRSYVVFGKTTGTEINLSAVNNGVGGFAINGQCTNDWSGVSVSSAGDVNGDGLADLIVGANFSDPTTGTNAGRSYVIFGSTTGVFGAGTLVNWLGTDGDDNQSDGGTAKTLVGGAGNDSLSATAASVLYGGSGNDSFTINQAMATALQSAFGAGGNVDRLSRIDGGSGTDTLVLSANTALDLGQVADSAAGDPEGNDRVASIERIDLSAAGSALTLSATDVAHLAGMNSFNSANGWSGLDASVARHQLVIDGAVGTLTANGTWNRAGTATYNGNSYTVYNGDNNTQLLLGGGRTLPVPPIELSAIREGVGGFVINGQCAADRSGYSVSSAGDVNGDGLADLIVGACQSDLAAAIDAGRSYVVFGKTTGTGIDLSAVANGVGGFVINGQCANDLSGTSVSSAGDVNGDGLADLIVGAYRSDPATKSDAGRSYVVFGKTTGTEINLSSVTAGTGGFVINGQCANDLSGVSVSSAGDVNGDGLADLIVGAYSPNSLAGRTYVVFGKTGGSTVNTAIELSAVAAGQGGFAINGQCASDYSGYRVSSAGDVNGDGLSDLIVGAYYSSPIAGANAGRSYVVFGKTTSSAINLSAVATGQGGFVINGQCSNDYSGSSVSSAGDVNGDGLADLIVGAPNGDPAGVDTAGCSYVVFGKTTGTEINLSAVAAGQGGFVINGQCSQDYSGVSVSSAGDINGDGLADLIVGANRSNSTTGRSYVVFGKTTSSAIDLSAVAAGQGGFVINGQCANDQSGVSVSSAGDVNGDGLADLIVGAQFSDPAAGANAGRSYVIFGSTSGTFMPSTTVQMGTTDNDALSDGGTAQLLVGNGGNDTLTATAASVLRGGNGSDTFVVNQTMVTALQKAYGQVGNNGDYNASIDGGHGGINSTTAFNTTTNVPSLDTLRLSGSSIALDLTQVSNVGHLNPTLNSRISGIEVIDLNGATNTLKLTAKDVLDISDAVDLSAISGKADYRQLVVRDSSVAGTISGRTATQVDLADGTGITPWVKANATVTGTNWGDASHNYVVYSNDSARAIMLVQQGIVVA